MEPGPAPPHKAKTFYALLLVSLVAAIVLALIGVDPISLLVVAAVINAIAAGGPFVIVLMLVTGSDGSWASTATGLSHTSSAGRPRSSCASRARSASTHW